MIHTAALLFCHSGLQRLIGGENKEMDSHFLPPGFIVYPAAYERVLFVVTKPLAVDAHPLLFPSLYNGMRLYPGKKCLCNGHLPAK